MLKTYPMISRSPVPTLWLPLVCFHALLCSPDARFVIDFEVIAGTCVAANIWRYRFF